MRHATTWPAIVTSIVSVLVMGPILLLAATIALAGASESDPVHPVVLLTPGPRWEAGRSFREQRGVREHLKYYEALADTGELILGGPFVDDTGGLLVFAEGLDTNHVRVVALEDPAVGTGVLGARVTTWSTPLRAADPIVLDAALPDIRAIVHHVPGGGWRADRTYRAQELVGSHLAYYGNLLERGRLLLGGPFGDDRQDLMVFAPGYDLSELRTLIDRSPALAESVLVAEPSDWLVIFKHAPGDR